MSADGGRILGLATVLPDRVRRNDAWPEAFKPRASESQRANILAIERSTRGDEVTPPPEIIEAMAVYRDDPWKGARERRVLDERAEPSDLEAQAARQAIRNAGLKPGDIDLLMVASLVPDRLHPSNAPAVQLKCELVNAVAWSVDVGCASFQAQYVSASALIRSGAYRHVLCVFSSAVSRVLDYSEGWSPNFGDGASAMVLGPGPAKSGLLGHWSRTDGSLREGVVYCPIVDGKPRPDWTAHAAPIRLTSLDYEGGKRAGLSSTAFCREASMGALAAAGLRVEDVDFFVCNQSVGWLVDACRRTLGFPTEKTIDSFAEVANIGAAVVPMHLERAWREGRLRDDSVVLIYSPGAGLTRAAVVLRWICP